MNYLTVEPLKSIKSKEEVSSITLSKENEEIVIPVPTETEPFNQHLSLINPDQPFLSKIKSEWFYKKYPIYLTDKNEILLVKLAIKQTIKDLKIIIRKINLIEISNNKAIPKRYYNLLEKKFDGLALDLIYLKKGFVELHEQYLQLENKQFELIATRDKLFNENERLKIKLTPRPNWSKCSSYFSGGAKRWESYIKSLTSNELVDILLNEFIGGNDGTNEMHMLQTQVNQGLNKTTKTYENIKLQKRDVLLFIHEILDNKSDYDNQRISEGLERETLKSFIYVYFLKKFKTKNLALQWYHNLIESLERFNFNENVKFFQLVLQGTVDEDVYHYFKRISTELYSLCKNTTSNQADLSSVYTDQASLNELQLDTISNVPSNLTNINSNSKVSMKQYKSNMELRKSSLKISRNSFIKVLKQQFPDIITTDIRSLINAAKADLINNAKRYKLKRKASKLLDDLFEDFDLFDFNIIFHINEDGSLTEFLKKLKVYLFKERINYILRFLKELIALKTLTISENSIKTPALTRMMFLTLIPAVAKSNVEISIKESKSKLHKLKSKKSKIKTLKRTMKSKMSLFIKRPKKSKIKKTAISKITVAAANSINIQKSNSMDSITSYEIDILENRIYNELISVDEFKTELFKHDPNISIIETQRYIDWVYKSEDSLKLAEVHLGRLIRELQKFNCYYH